MLDLDTNYLVKLYKSGQSPREIAELVGADKGTVALRLKRAGIDLRANQYARMGNTFAEKRTRAHADLARLYNEGRSTRELSEQLGIPQDTVARRLKALGIDLKAKQYVHSSAVLSKPRLQLPDTEIVKLFQKGMSTKTLADKFGCSRRAIDQRLLNAGLQPRNGSESMRLRVQKMTKQQRQQLAAAAHAAVKGKRYTFEELCSRAQSRQATCYPNRLKANERAFYDLSGMVLIPQFAIGPYSADFRVAGTPITVEVFGGKWHTAGKHRSVFRQRSEHIRDAGFVSVIIWCFDGIGVERGCLDYVEALVRKARRKKAVLREQYVIRGNGQPTTFGSDKLDYLSGVMRFEDGQRVVSLDD